MFLKNETLCFFIFYISISILTQANLLDPAENDPRKYRKVPNLVKKNQILSSFKIRQVCMDVCNPPYYSQEYLPSYGNQYGQYGQYYPSGGYGYGGYDSAQNYYPQNQYGEYYPWCYRDMFRKKYNIDPGKSQPRVFHYKKLTNENSAVYRRDRNYNYYQDYINCQRICYPMMVPEIKPTASTARTKVTRPRTTKITTTTEANESNGPSEVTEATLSPPEKPDNDTTTSKTTATISSTTSTSPSNGTNGYVQSSNVTSEVPVTTAFSTEKPQGNTKRNAKFSRKNKEDKKKIKSK